MFGFSVRSLDEYKRQIQDEIAELRDEVGSIVTDEVVSRFVIGQLNYIDDLLRQDRYYDATIAANSLRAGVMNFASGLGSENDG